MVSINRILMLNIACEMRNEGAPRKAKKAEKALNHLLHPYLLKLAVLSTSILLQIQQLNWPGLLLPTAFYRPTTAPQRKRSQASQANWQATQEEASQEEEASTWPPPAAGSLLLLLLPPPASRLRVACVACLRSPPASRLRSPAAAASPEATARWLLSC